MEKWDDIFDAAKPSDDRPEATPSTTTPKKADPWSELEPEAKEATVRLNVDIPISINDALAAKARRLKQPKTVLVRKLLEWALSDDLSK